ncbi:saccharopine dehydrogenase NADP-binding domain-containing protein [Paremcibacter congregatus]|uniref:saccharopine dehydrogenase NADP-binding domain-containing protein n=1 Tax=Paremcibacter congregatus TaxID=2043170 RepID=UPI0030ED0A2A
MFPQKVIIAGRDLEKASKAANNIGHGVTARVINITSKPSSEIFEDITLVLSCINQVTTDFVEQCFRNGTSYINISAGYNFIAQVEKFDEIAKQHHATAILGVGVSPRLTNLIAAHLLRKSGLVLRIDIILELGLGDHHGKARISHKVLTLFLFYVYNQWDSIVSG